MSNTKVVKKSILLSTIYRMRAWQLSIGVGFLTLSTSLYADTWGTRGTAMGGEAKGLATAVDNFGVFAGLLLVIVGLVMVALSKSNRQGGSMGGGVFMAIIGALLAAAPLFINTTSETILGESAASGLEKIGVE